MATSLLVASSSRALPAQEPAIAVGQATIPLDTSVFNLYRSGQIDPRTLQILNGLVDTGAENEGCAANPIVSLLAPGEQRTSVDGSRVFPIGRESRHVVVGVLVDPESVGENNGANSTEFGAATLAPGSRDVFLVLDELTISETAVESARHQAESLFVIERFPGEVHLLAKPLDFRVCVDLRSAVAPELSRQLAADLAAPYVWVSPIDRPELANAAERYLASLHVRTISLSGIRRIRTYVMGTDLAQATTTGPMTDEWKMAFALGQRNTDRCANTGGELLCSNDIRLYVRNAAIVPPLPPALLGSDLRRFVRLHIESTPSGAAIFHAGAKLNAQTTARLDVRAQEVAALSLQLPGFAPCPARNWQMNVVEGPRRVVLASCELHRARPSGRR